ncbi:MAG: Fis family transcriptional regulator [Nevskiaceae bacterium]|nr:MAG: Fis family transcriptional regulator [Nevskiaceae bacterium]TBR73187.1 MAG: Fis family transcriptional regulator [Nevskiaceae bacterium]
MAHYFAALGEHAPNDVYSTVLAQVEPPLLRAALQYCQGNQSRTAEVLGINRTTLRKKLNTYTIDPAGI